MITDFEGLHIIDTKGLTCFPVSVPMLLEFDGIRLELSKALREDVEKRFTDDMREELYEEVKRDFIGDIQNGLDDKESKIDGLTAEAEEMLRSIQNAASDLSDRLDEITNTTAMDAEDWA